MEQLYYNGKIFTAQHEDSFVNAFRVVDGKFSWVGNLQNPPEEEGAINLEGRTVIPGLIDAHTHPSYVAGTIDAVPCTIPKVHSISEMIEALKRHPNAGKGPDEWIQGWGYDESKLDEHRTPTRHDLDLVSTTQPVYVLRSDCHSGICNTRALELAGITKDTPDPEGGRFGRDPDGSPNGVLTELAANAAVRSVMEKPNFENAVRALANTNAHYCERGYVAATDMMVFFNPLNQLEVFRAAEKAGLDMQISLYFLWTGGKDPYGMHDCTPEERTGRVKWAGIKLFADGSISGKTAWVSTPYAGSDDCGMCTLDIETLQAAYEYAKRNRLQISIHVMGDRSIQRIIDFFDDKEPWLDGQVANVRLEHVTLLNKKQLDQMNASKMNYGLTTQIIFGFAEYDGYEKALTPEVFKLIYPLKLFSENMRALALSADAPATTWADPDDVFVSLKAAITRRAYNGASINPDESIPVNEALMLYTKRAALLCPYETPVGQIARGFEADFNVLSEDLFTVAPNEIDRVRIDAAYRRGERVFEREAACEAKEGCCCECEREAAH